MHKSALQVVLGSNFEGYSQIGSPSYVANSGGRQALTMAGDAPEPAVPAAGGTDGVNVAGMAPTAGARKRRWSGRRPGCGNICSRQWMAPYRQSQPTQAQMSQPAGGSKRKRVAIVAGVIVSVCLAVIIMILHQFTASVLGPGSSLVDRAYAYTGSRQKRRRVYLFITSFSYPPY
jgi:hypothetical protein